MACLFSPSITIKNVLLRNVVTTVKQRVKAILEMVPESTVQLGWIPGKSNSADMVSKLFHDPFTQASFNLFGFGPDCFRNDGTKHIFLELTKSLEKYFPLPDEILKVERKKAKKLVVAGAQESSGNIEVEKLQCMRCQGDETDCYVSADLL